jgi:TonB family protein
MPVCLAQVAAAETARRQAGQRRFWAALALSASLHAALLAINNGRQGTQNSNPLGHGKALSVRLPSQATAPAATAATEDKPQSPPPILRQDSLRLETPTTPSATPTTGVQTTTADPKSRPAEPGEGMAAGQSAAGVPLLTPMRDVREFSVPATLQRPLRFSYPAQLPVQGGRVRVRLLLNDKGAIEDMRVIASAPKGVFDREALALLRTTDYVPAYIGSYAMRSYLFLELTFGAGQNGQQVYFVANTRVAENPLTVSPAASIKDGSSQ